VDQVRRWTTHELIFESTRSRPDPFWAVDLAVEFTTPSGRSFAVDAFWDGERVWRARVRPDENGEWQWQSQGSDRDDTGLHGRSGTFSCTPYDGPNPVYRHGPVRVADDGYALAHADGMPFLWLGDTVWNGLIRSTAEDWDAYLCTRRAQGYSVIQFFSTHWRALATNQNGETSYTENGRFTVNPAFYQRLDPKVAAIADHGLLASAIVVLALYDEEPGWAWPIDQLIRFARWLRARWGAYHIAWSLGGDGDFSGERAERWKQIGAAVYANPPEDLVTMHPKGWSWVGDEFRDQSWATFYVYQSGHSDEEAKIRWLPEGPHTTDWLKKPRRPIINVEPNYEDHPSYASGVRFTAGDVRRASYWSLLVTPTVGVTYGHFSLWAWAGEREPVGQAIRRQAEYIVEPWWSVLDTPGAQSMTILRRYFESGEWWTLRPAQDLLAEQPGTHDARRFVAAARTASRDWIVVYLTEGGSSIRLSSGGASGMSARWFNPRNGHWSGVEPPAEAEGRQFFVAPDAGDWVLDLRR
jgi:Protein of unknown function (DUF4038)/Domain of unknown function (DUF5060)/Putative collagen-binding domain of a collagenase